MRADEMKGKKKIPKCEKFFPPPFASGSAGLHRKLRKVAKCGCDGLTAGRRGELEKAAAG